MGLALKKKRERGPKAAASSPEPSKVSHSLLAPAGQRDSANSPPRRSPLSVSPSSSSRAGRCRRAAPPPPVQCPQPACSALPLGSRIRPYSEVVTFRYSILKFRTVCRWNFKIILSALYLYSVRRNQLFCFMLGGEMNPSSMSA